MYDIALPTLHYVNTINLVTFLATVGSFYRHFVHYLVTENNLVMFQKHKLIVEVFVFCVAHT